MRLTPRYDGPPIPSIDGDADDHAVPVARQRRRLESLLAGLDDGEWQAASRCEGWTVQDVVSHLVGVNAFWEASVKAGVDGTPTRVLAGFDPAAHPPLMVDGMRSLSSAALFEQFAASNDGFLGALATLDDNGWSTLAESPVGHVSIRLIAHHALWDAWVHERDIALPLGMTPTEEADEVASCLRYAAALSPALAISERAARPEVLAVHATDPDLQFTLEVGKSVAVRDHTARAGTPYLRGAAVDLVEALSMRAPLPADAPPEWRRMRGGLATAFDAPLDTP